MCNTNLQITGSVLLLLQELAEWNRQYEAKFGFVFLICAQDKCSSDILDALKVCTFHIYLKRCFSGLKHTKHMVKSLGVISTSHWFLVNLSTHFTLMERFHTCFGNEHVLLHLQERYSNRPIDELNNAASEQEKITELRLAKLMSLDSDSHRM